MGTPEAPLIRLYPCCCRWATWSPASFRNNFASDSLSFSTLAPGVPPCGQGSTWLIYPPLSCPSHPQELFSPLTLASHSMFTSDRSRSCDLNSDLSLVLLLESPLTPYFFHWVMLTACFPSVLIQFNFYTHPPINIINCFAFHNSTSSFFFFSSPPPPPVACGISCARD